MLSGQFHFYSPGLACAGRRETFEKLGLFYDRAVTGAADSVMIRAFTGWRFFNLLMGLSKGLVQRQDAWSRHAYAEVQGSLFYTSGTIFHLWHGTFKDRRYVARDDILRSTGFDPNCDVRLNRNGILEWATNDQELKEGLIEYFWLRNEEGQIETIEKTEIKKTMTQSVKKAPRKIKLKKKIQEWRINYRKHKIHWRKTIRLRKILLRRRFVRIMNFNISSEYYRLLGLVGQKIRSNNQDLYLKLKKYFPDKN